MGHTKEKVNHPLKVISLCAYTTYLFFTKTQSVQTINRGKQSPTKDNMSYVYIYRHTHFFYRDTILRERLGREKHENHMLKTVIIEQFGRD